MSYATGFLHDFDQCVHTKPQDITIFSLRKFMELAAKGNPNALEILFTDPSDHLKMTDAAEMLLEHRDAFLSKKLKHTLSGYAYAQIKRIKTHRRWILHPPAGKPSRADYNLPERTVIPADQIATATALVHKQIEAWDLDLEPLDEPSRIELQGRLATILTEMGLASDEKFRAAGRVIGFSENFLELLAKERAYNAAKAEYDQYEHWKKTRNAARYAIEEKYGFDTKHGMHVCRLIRTCIDVFETGKYIVKRPDAEELLTIRNGAWSYDQLLAYAEEKTTYLDSIYETSSLPREPNRKLLDSVCQSITESWWRNNAGRYTYAD
jgi:predicted nucleotidyltransferase